jgi:hypothetical protein
LLVLGPAAAAHFVARWLAPSASEASAEVPAKP